MDNVIAYFYVRLKETAIADLFLATSASTFPPIFQGPDAEQGQLGWPKNQSEQGNV